MTNPMIATAASTAFNYFLPDLSDAISRRDYIADSDADSLADAISDDMRDALHNANLDFYIDGSILLSLSDDDINALSDFYLDNIDDIAALIAAALELL